MAALLQEEDGAPKSMPRCNEGFGDAAEELGLRLDLMAANPALADPETIRLLCQSAGHIPESRRQEVWRLLLIGRVKGYSELGQGPKALSEEIMGTSLDLENQRVIRVDVLRTRPSVEQFKREDTRAILSAVLTYYCKERNVGYKQGMHEVLAPFIALSDPPMMVTDVHLCYAAFIEHFLPYAFNRDEEFLSLQICFRLFHLLLRYHHPALSTFLEQYHMQPELYATPWFLTLFSSSMPLKHLYTVWDQYLSYGDPALHHFVVLAYVMHNADVILEASEADLPATMCKLPKGMNSHEEVNTLLDAAHALMGLTPKSFCKILSSALYSRLSSEDLTSVLTTLQASSCIPVAAEEVVHSQVELEPEAPMEERFVNLCYTVMDCRTTSHYSKCHLETSVHLDPDLLKAKDSSYVEDVVAMFSPLKAKAHICLVGKGASEPSLGGIILKPSTGTPVWDRSGEAMGLRQKKPSRRNVKSPVANAGANAGAGAGDGDGAGAKIRTPRKTLTLPASISPTSSPTASLHAGEGDWKESILRALSRSDERESSCEEDEKVNQWVHFLLSQGFPYVSHIRGDFLAVLQALQVREYSKDECTIEETDTSSSGCSHTCLAGTGVNEVWDRVLLPTPKRGKYSTGQSLFSWGSKDERNTLNPDKHGEDDPSSDKCLKQRAMSADSLASLAPLTATALGILGPPSEGSEAVSWLRRRSFGGGTGGGSSFIGKLVAKAEGIAVAAKESKEERERVKEKEKDASSSSQGGEHPSEKGQGKPPTSPEQRKGISLTKKGSLLDKMMAVMERRDEVTTTDDEENDEPAAAEAGDGSSVDISTTDTNGRPPVSTTEQEFGSEEWERSQSLSSPHWCGVFQAERVEKDDVDYQSKSTDGIKRQTSRSRSRSSSPEKERCTECWLAVSHRRVVQFEAAVASRKGMFAWNKQSSADEPATKAVKCHELKRLQKITSRKNATGIITFHFSRSSGGTEKEELRLWDHEGCLSVIKGAYRQGKWKDGEGSKRAKQRQQSERAQAQAPKPTG